MLELINDLMVSLILKKDNNWYPSLIGFFLHVGGVTRIFFHDYLKECSPIAQIPSTWSNILLFMDEECNILDTLL